MFSTPSRFTFSRISVLVPTTRRIQRQLTVSNTLFPAQASTSVYHASENFSAGVAESARDASHVLMVALVGLTALITSSDNVKHPFGTICQTDDGQVSTSESELSQPRVSKASPCASAEELQVLVGALAKAKHCDVFNQANVAAAQLKKAWPASSVWVRWAGLERGGKVMGEGFDFWAEVDVGEQQSACAYVRRGGHAIGSGTTRHPPELSKSVVVAGQEGIEVLETTAGFSELRKQTVIQAVSSILGRHSGSREALAPASALYYALAEADGYTAPVVVFWNDMHVVRAGHGNFERLTLHVAACNSVIDILTFPTHPVPIGSCYPEARLLLAPAGAGKSTWRALAPAYCPEGEVLETTAYRYAYGIDLHRAPDSWMTGQDGMDQVWRRNMVMVASWLRADPHCKLTYNCSGSMLDWALGSGILFPEEVCVVLPPETLHRRNIQSRASYGRREEWVSTWGYVEPNRNSLAQAAVKHGLRIAGSFDVAISPSTPLYVWIKSGHGFLAQPQVALLRAQKLNSFMIMGRHLCYVDAGGEVEIISDPLILDGLATWMLCPAGSSFIVKSLDGFLLAKGGRLISAEDPYTQPVFWTVDRHAASNELTLRSEVGEELCATQFFGDAIAEPWQHSLPIDRLWPVTEKKKGPQKPVIIWYAGSFAPFHGGHFDCVAAVRDYFMEKGQPVVGGYVQAHPEKSLAYKRMQGLVSVLSKTEHRLAVIQHFIADCDWLMSDNFNALRGSGSNFGAILSLRSRMIASLRKVGEGDTDVDDALACVAEAEIIWVMGDDSFPSFLEKVQNPGSWHSEQLKKVLASGIRLCVVHNRPEQRMEVSHEAVDALDVLEVEAATQFCGDRSATVARQSWVSGASCEELASLLGNTQAADYLVRLRNKLQQSRE